jgi:hypothetical protein
MHTTIRTRYRGWNITASCIRHHDSNPAAAIHYTARAFATLHDSVDGTGWTDCGTQTSAFANTAFTTTATCSDAIMAQIKTLIDTLRPACHAEKMA